MKDNNKYNGKGQNFSNNEDSSINDLTDISLGTKLDEKINSALASWKIPSYTSKDKIWQAIERKINLDADVESDESLESQEVELSSSEKSTQRKIVSFPRRKILQGLSLVASIILISIIGLYYFGNKTVYSVGTHLTQVFPDKSEAHLMPNSEITYNRFFFSWSRKIDMKGEVFYKVNKGSKFTVFTSENQKIEVLGTQFQIISRPTFFKVFCTEGKVGVSPVNVKDSKNKSQFILSENEGLSVINNKIDNFSSTTNSEVILQRLQGKYHYTNALLTHVLEDFGYAYNKKVTYLGDNKSYTGYFDDNNIEKALTLICEPFGLTFEINGDIIIK